MSKYKYVCNIPNKSCLWQTDEIVFTNSKMAKEEDCDGQDTMRGIMLKDVPYGEFFKLNPTDSASVYSKDCYDRLTKKIMCTNEKTGTERVIDRNKIVYVGFWY